MKKARPPIVTVLGHVDHGKTTLLDAIRSSNVTAREAGGITQGIGASQIKNITFVDTPGHALFSGMRLRGAKLADIAVLAVAGDDGVKPQTKEAIQVIREANIPFVVAVTKADLPAFSLENALGQLEKEGVLFEKRGGDTPYMAVSAKTKQGVDELLELIGLVAQVNQISGDSEGDLEAVVIETSKDKRGLLVSVVVRNGKLKVGDTIYTANGASRVRGLFDQNRKSVREAGPGEPVQILGFDKLPEVGAVIGGKEVELPVAAPSISLRASPKEGIAVYIKAKTAGALEALINNIPEGIAVAGSAVGDVNEGDVGAAKNFGARGIFAFESKVSGSVAKLAENEGVKIETFKIIYELMDRLTELVNADKKEVMGAAEIVAVFPFNSQRVAGARITQGRILKTENLILKRGEKELGRVKVVSLRKGKEEINEARQGEECGLIFTPQLDFTMGDVLVSIK